ncbi:MAG: ShlB/FhaC/HecB family hemolysin secretion/activation protein [Leptolyngbyaceae cyanobacterium]
MTLSPRTHETDTTPRSSATAVESGAEDVAIAPDNAPTEELSGGTLLKAVTVLALLGMGVFSFSLVKPLMESWQDDVPLPQPRHTVATREDFPLVRIPSSSRSPSLPTQPTTESGAISGITAAAPSNGVTPTSPPPSASEPGRGDPVAQVRLIPAGARQPGTVDAPPSAPLPAMPVAEAPAPSAPSAPPNQQLALPNSVDLRRTVRNLARSLPGPSQPLPSVASSPQPIARLPLPEEPGVPSMLPDSLNATGDIPSSPPADPTPGPSIPLTIQPPPAQHPPAPSTPEPTAVLPPVQPSDSPRLQPIPANPTQPVPPDLLQPIPAIPANPTPQLTPPAPVTTIPSILNPPEAASPEEWPDVDELVAVDPPLVPSPDNGSTNPDEANPELVNPELVNPDEANPDEAIAIIPPAERTPIPNEVALNGFNITGNTVFSTEELTVEAQRALVAPAEETLDDSAQQPFEIPAIVSLSQLIQASDRITQRYVNEGYISSGAIIPEDGIQANGTVEIQVIEGRLESIDVARSPNRQQSLLNHPLSPPSPLSALTEWIFPAISRPRMSITGNRDLSFSYVRQRLARAGSAPLNLNRLLAGVQLLQTDPLIETVATEIQDGTATGTNILDVDIVEAPTTAASVTVDNARSPSVGSIQQRASLIQGNFLGFGDRLALGANQTEGSDGWNVNYAIPINARNGTLSFAYSNSASEVIEDPFTVLDIQSESRSYEFTLRQPLVQTAAEEFTLSLTASRRESKSEFLADLQGEAEPFPATGADADGETNISALRFAQAWTRQGSRQVFALRSELSVGLDALNSTINPIRPDSRFFSWRGQGQWVRQVGSDAIVLLRGDIQLADGPLVPGEQFSLGGQSTLRGFRQDSLLTDNGWLASAEFRIPVLRVPTVDGVLQVAPFVEIGQGWNPKETDPESNTLASTGLGLLWRMGDRFASRLDWGIPLLGDTSEGSSLQEDGFHFSIQFSPF